MLRLVRAVQDLTAHPTRRHCQRCLGAAAAPAARRTADPQRQVWRDPGVLGDARSVQQLFDTMLPDGVQVANPYHHVVQLAIQAVDECP